MYVHVCMYVSICVSVHVCMYVCTCMYVSICVSVHVCMYVSIYLCICTCMYVEGKIYSQTDIISDRRLQRSKHGSNCARSSEQQDMLALG